jgi:hypothetical protein
MGIWLVYACEYYGHDERQPRTCLGCAFTWEGAAQIMNSHRQHFSLWFYDFEKATKS